MSLPWVENNRIGEKKQTSLIECRQESVQPCWEIKAESKFPIGVNVIVRVCFMALRLCAVLRPPRSWRRTRSRPHRGQLRLRVQTPGASCGRLFLLPDGEHLLHYQSRTTSPPQSRWSECFVSLERSRPTWSDYESIPKPLKWCCVHRRSLMFITAIMEESCRCSSERDRTNTPTHRLIWSKKSHKNQLLNAKKSEKESLN